MSRFEVPDAWYNLSARLSAALTVINAINLHLPCGDLAKPVMPQLDSIGDLAAAAGDILQLCKTDCEVLGAALREHDRRQERLAA